MAVRGDLSGVFYNPAVLGYNTQKELFLLSELALELARCKPQSAPGCLPTKDVSNAIQSVISEIRTGVPKDATGAATNLQGYVNRVFQTIGS